MAMDAEMDWRWQGVSFPWSKVKMWLTFDFCLTLALQPPSSSYLNLFPKVLETRDHDLKNHEWTWEGWLHKHTISLYNIL